MFILLITVFALMLWSVQLMVSAFRQSDFSLLFAGTLVALSSAGIVTAYSLMNGCMGYLSASDVVASGPLRNDIPVAQSVRITDSSPQWLDDMPLIEVDS